MELFHIILMSADTYHLFAKEMRPKLKEENPNLSFTELPKELCARWRALSDGEKAKYKSDGEKAKYKSNKEEEEEEEEGGL